VQSDEPFGHLTFRAPEGQLWVKWRRVEQDVEDETTLLERCRAEPARCSSPAARAFLTMIEDAEAREGRARLQVVNRYFNAAVRYESDLAQHGVLDLWTAPLATLAARRGDCEDYAIAKYVALRKAGRAAQDLRLVLVNDLWARQHHAVVAARHGGRWLILDNRSDRLLEESEVGKFVPLFALDHEGVKLFASPYAAERPVERAPALASPGRSTGPDAVAAAGSSGRSIAPLLM
jgi:predicted transglutaminase-like cysteine proteinase